MNWDAVGAIAEVLGAIGVIVSLLYLANQIRQSTQTEKARAHQDIFSALSAHTDHMRSATQRGYPAAEGLAA